MKIQKSKFVRSAIVDKDGPEKTVCDGDSASCIVNPIRGHFVIQCINELEISGPRGVMRGVRFEVLLNDAEAQHVFDCLKDYLKKRRAEGRKS